MHRQVVYQKQTVNDSKRNRKW